MTQSISQLLKKEWPPLDSKASAFHRRLRAAVTKPLDALDSAEMRLLISQDIGLAYIMPLALTIVEQDPLVEVEHFRGDLLAAMLRASADFYADNTDMYRRMNQLVDRVAPELDRLDQIDFDTTSEAIEEALLAFRAHRR